ncbi:hypothetical protein GSI_03165 [Ganoderma sinense ZZ0214-1]|uniref:Uncharacterized protein n=1 Tax=Ganoderma sinense ZZ0214-1 TaxID=1077348 RepID=A0A2G8SKV8_9APHY|nr:hypothetical protein GSI_03165 [Ganoderma sinense ZZ0214-1]
MASSLASVLVILLFGASALADISSNHPITPINGRHLRLNQRRNPYAPKLLDSPSCTLQTGLINVTSTHPSLNGYLAIPPPPDHGGVYGQVTDAMEGALRVSFCDCGELFDIIALNGPFQEAGYPAIGGTEEYPANITEYVLLVGTQQGLQGPPKPGNSTTIDKTTKNVRSVIWTIDSRNSFIPHWQHDDSTASDVPITLAHSIMFSPPLPGPGPTFLLTEYFEVFARLSPTDQPAIVEFLFVPN